MENPSILEGMDFRAEAIRLWEGYGPHSILVMRGMLAKPTLAPCWKKYWFEVGIWLDRIDRGEYTPI